MFSFDRSYKNFKDIPSAVLLEVLLGEGLKVTAACKVIAVIDGLVRLAYTTPDPRMEFGLNFMEDWVKITAFLAPFDELGLAEETPVMTLKGVTDGNFECRTGDDGRYVVTLYVQR
ncbi:hypothetical protein AB0C84_11325 [Actinomadura sp. NPDC048955]|uniref:hypothetical protein n=1 Tax=Actinomadura sp. NPDC048955 TaxID=3158228 RepID=UPI0033F84B05